MCPVSSVFNSASHMAMFQRLVKQSKIPFRYNSAFLKYYQTMDTFQSSNKAKIEKMLSYDFDKNLILMGTKGTGKTHFICTYLIEYLKEFTYSEERKSVLFYDCLEMFQDIKASYGKGTTDKILDEIVSADILVIDDIGCMAMTDDEQKNLFYIINKRYNEELQTFITSNQQDLNFLTPAIIDRLTENSMMLKFTGKSYRGTLPEIVYSPYDVDYDFLKSKELIKDGYTADDEI